MNDDRTADEHTWLRGRLDPDPGDPTSAADALAQERAILAARLGRAVVTVGDDQIGDLTAPLADRFDLFRKSHPTAFCRRDRFALVEALAAIDEQAAQIAALQAEVAALREVMA